MKGANDQLSELSVNLGSGKRGGEARKKCSANFE
jgi:hypothetical protein